MQLQFDLSKETTTLTDQETKRCTRCGQFKPQSEFGKASKAKDGLFWTCKECSRAKGREKMAEHAVWPPSLEGTKLCPVCHQEKLKSDFCLVKTTKDGSHKCCRVCDKARCKETAAKNREKNRLNPPSMDGEKFCKECGEWKPKTEFFVNMSSKDGFHHRCKAC